MKKIIFTTLSVALFALISAPKAFADPLCSNFTVGTGCEPTQNNTYLGTCINNSAYNAQGVVVEALIHKGDGCGKHGSWCTCDTNKPTFYPISS